MDKNIEIRRLELEERRLDEEMQLRKSELELRKKELEIQQKKDEITEKEKSFFAKIFSPVGVAVIVGLIGLLGTAASGIINVYVENNKHQSELLLKISDAKDEKQRALNLLFYAKGGYLTFSSEYEAYLRGLAGLTEKQEIPPPSSLSFPEDIKRILPSAEVSGLELDNHSPEIDLSKMKQHGSQFVFIKVSQGEKFKDKDMNKNINAASKAGLKIGLFHFFEPQSDLDKQAENFISELKTNHWDLPPTIDCEEFSNQPIPNDYAEKVYKFATKIQDETGFKPIIYTHFSFANQHLDARFKEFPLTIATNRRDKKPKLPSWWADFLFWHYDFGWDDPEFKGINKFVYNGTNDAFNHLPESLKVSSNNSPQ